MSNGETPEEKLLGTTVINPNFVFPGEDKADEITVYLNEGDTFSLCQNLLESDGGGNVIVMSREQARSFAKVILWGSE